MNDQNLEQRIRDAVGHATPDKLQQILSSCDQQKGPVITMTNPKKRNWTAPLIAVAASLVLVMGGVFGYGWHTVRAVDSRITLDVNPSISITVNSKERVLNVDALNDDAAAIIGNMDLKGTQLEVAVNALIGSMMQNGYLDELQNSILVSVENSDNAKALALQQKVTDAINAPFAATGLEPAVLSQSVTDDAELEKLASQNGISTGKAALIQTIMALDPTLTAENLSALTVNDLSVILNSRQSDSNTITQTGTASSKAYITQDEAKAAAFAHAGVQASQVSRCDIEFDSEDGAMVYELEFFVGNTEYEYDIDARTADVVKFSKENRGSAASSGSNSSSGNTTSTDSVGITEARAKEIAFTHAGVKEADVSNLKIKLDYGWYYTKYELEFFVGTKEYDYEIDANSGKVLEYSVEGNSAQTSGNSNAGSATVSEAKAKEIAFAHAGVTEADVSGIKIELDKGWYHTKYELEFYADGKEFDYEIDAVSGDVLEYSTEGGVPSGGNTNSNGSGQITADEAKAIAFNYAGVTESDISKLKVELDDDDHRYVYEIEFNLGRQEFSCTILASDGTVLEAEWDD